MNRIDFMRQLESLLQNISSTEREEALQYYNDYFDDAGADNEQEVIEALGNPARVAENIKKDLFGSIGEGSFQRARASDRAVIEYDQTGADAGQDAQQRGSTGPGGGPGQGGFDQYSGRSEGGFRQVPPNGASCGGNGGQSAYRQPDPGKKPDMPAWAVVLLIVLLVLASPIILPVAVGLLGALVGLLLGWFGIILGFGVAAVCLMAVFVILLIVGFTCMAVDPLVGAGLIGGSFICGGIGILFLMLTVAMTGIVTPLIFKCIGRLFHWCRK